MDFNFECRSPNCEFTATKVDLEAHELVCENRLVACRWCSRRVGFETHEDHELRCGLQNSLGRGTTTEGPHQDVQLQHDVQPHHGHHHHQPQDFDNVPEDDGAITVYHDDHEAEDDLVEPDYELFLNLPTNDGRPLSPFHRHSTIPVTRVSNEDVLRFLDNFRDLVLVDEIDSDIEDNPTMGM